MGIIIKQSIKGSIWSYLGVAVGFITTAYLFPNYLTTDTIGLFGILLAYSGLFAQFSSLGFHGVTSRLFPYFRDKEKKHNGFVFIAFAVMFTGFLLFILVFFSIKNLLVENNIEKSKLFVDYVYLLLPLTFFSLLFVQLDVYNKVLYNAVFGAFLQEFLQRVLIFVITVLFVFKVFSLHQLILAYAAVVSLKGLFIFLYLLLKGEISVKPRWKFIDKSLRKEMLNVAVFSILTGFGSSIVFNVDKIVINQVLGLGQTGVYTIAFFFGTLVIIPSRPLLRISGTLIADAFKRDDLDYIFDIYKKSCLNQFIIGAFLFGGIWVNIDGIIQILGPEYEDGKWVIFFIGIGYLIDMLTGANAHIIAYSKHFRVVLYFILILIVQVVVTMILLVPILGILGGAIAISFSFLVNNFMRFLFLHRKYGFQPFRLNFLLIVFAFFAAYAVGYFLPEFPLVADLLLRSAVFTVVYGSIITGFKISDDVNNTIYNLYSELKKRMLK